MLTRTYIFLKLFFNDTITYFIITCFIEKNVTKLCVGIANLLQKMLPNQRHFWFCLMSIFFVQLLRPAVLQQTTQALNCGK